MPYLTDINRYTHKVVMGYNADVDSAAWEDIIPEGGTYTALTATTGEHIHLDSGSVEDDPDKGGGTPGTGAHEVTVYYIDSNGVLQHTHMAPNGTATSAASTPTDVCFINGAYVTDAGTGLCAAGAITVRNAADDATIATIAAGQSQAFQALYQVPTGYAFDITGMRATSWIAASGASLSYVRLLIKNWNMVAGTLVSSNSEHYYTAIQGVGQVDFIAPLTVPAGCIIRMQAKGQADDNIVTGHFEGFLYKV
jgi:hypothetical protein